MKERRVGGGQHNFALFSTPAQQSFEWEIYRRLKRFRRFHKNYNLVKVERNSKNGRKLIEYRGVKEES